MCIAREYLYTGFIQTSDVYHKSVGSKWSNFPLPSYNKRWIGMCVNCENEWGEKNNLSGNYSFRLIIRVPL
jgi:hypothetical protein